VVVIPALTDTTSLFVVGYLFVRVEEEAREAGLQTNVLKEDNKGFLMLSKLGFK
jgi:hypothetical protein